MDATPILEPGERVLDSVALPVEDWIVRMLCAVLGMRRNARRDAPIGQRLSEGGRTVGPVGEQEAGVRQLLDDRGSGLVIVVLSPGIWWIGSSLNLSGPFVQTLQMYSYGVRPRRVLSRRAKLYAETKSPMCRRS